LLVINAGTRTVEEGATLLNNQYFMDESHYDRKVNLKDIWKLEGCPV